MWVHVYNSQAKWRAARLCPYYFTIYSRVFDAITRAMGKFIGGTQTNRQPTPKRELPSYQIIVNAPQKLKGILKMPKEYAIQPFTWLVQS